MKLPPRATSRLGQAAAAVWLAAGATGHALTYHISYLEDEGKRGQITAVMNEAVAVYNANTNIEVDINVIYSSGIPTAQSDYNGTLGFGGSISTQVALHEIAHYLGSGTIGQWDNQWGGGNVWQGAALRRYVKFFDGPGGEIYKSGVHYYPYGFNYGSEDSPDARLRLPRLIQAMRFDMGLQDGDGDGMSDEWERYKIGSTGQNGAADADGDGISNYDEWWTDSDPLKPCPVKHGHTYQIRSKLSQKMIEAADATAGANVRQNAPSGSDLQKWTAFYVGGGFWKLLNVAGGKALEVASYSTAAGGNIIAWNDTGGTNQQWRIVPDGGLYSKMFNNNSQNLVVDVEGGVNATGNLTNISQYYDVAGATNQDWVFDDVTPGEPAFQLAAEYKLDGNGRDFSGRGLHGTVSGGVTYGAGRVDGEAGNFDGTSGFIRIPASVDTNFSIACWIKTTATGGVGQWYNGKGFVDAEVPGVAKDFGLALVGNKAAFGVGAADFTITSTNSVNDGNWHHLVATLDTGSGAMKLYVDGLLQASGTGPASARTGPVNFHLGSIGGVTGFLNGSLDEVRLYKGLLTPVEISRLANVGSTLVAGYSMEGDLLDASRHANHGYPLGVTYVPGRVGTSAMQFNGTNSFATIPAAVTADFSVAFWVKTTATGGTGQWWQGKAIVDAELSGATEDWGIALVGNKVGFGIGNPDKTILSTSAINDGTWHHVTATRTQAGAMKLYVDGAQQATDSGPTASRRAPGAIRLGGSLVGGAFFAGAIDELKIFNYPLANPQVAALATSLPAPWASADVGTPGSDGYAGYSSSGGVFTVVGGGSEIGGASDQFQFVSSAQSGNQSVVARVTTVPANARGGLMFRNTTAADSPFVGLVYENPAGLRFMRRDAAGATATQVGSTVPVALPFWLKMTRAGNSFTAFYTTVAGPPAESDWLALGAQTTPLIASPLAGLAVTSRTAGQVATATFTNLSISPTRPDELWRQQYFGTIVNAGNAADNMDPDADTLSNLLERALGLNPTVTNTPAERPTLALGGGFLSLAYTRSVNATDLSIGAQWSNDLAVWSNTGVIDELISTNGAVESHVAKVPLSNVDPLHAFIRLEIH